MRPFRIGVLVTTVTLTQGCALLNAAKTGNLAGAADEARREATLLADSKAYGDRECGPIKTTELSWEEERAVGSAVSVGLATKGGHFFIDGVTEKDPAKLNAQLAQGKRVELPKSAKNDLTAWLSVVGRNLARYSSRPELPWTFGVIDNETPNAFSAPGGYVVVTTGLLKRVSNEAQLAGVLAHEIAHVVHKHSLKRYKEAKFMQCSVALAAQYYSERSPNLPGPLRDALRFSKRFGPGGKVDLDAPDDDGFVAFVVKKVLELMELFGNEKEDEFQADETALDLIAFAGYDAAEYEAFLSSLGSQGGGFSKHPSTADRVAKLKAHREGELRPFATGAAKPDVSKALEPLKEKQSTAATNADLR
jgi:hypothetical protein